MKTLRPSSLVGLITVLTAVSTTALAGPGLQYWLRTKPAAPVKAARIEEPTDTPGCSGCKTVPVTEYKTTLPNGKNIPHRVKIGTKHSCDHCTGEIAVVNGRTTDTMRHDDAKCGETSGLCCSGAAPKPAPEEGGTLKPET